MKVVVVMVVVVDMVFVVVHVPMVLVLEIVVVMVVMVIVLVLVLMLVDVFIVDVVVRWKISVASMAADESRVVTRRRFVSCHAAFCELLHHLDELSPVVLEEVVRNR